MPKPLGKPRFLHRKSLGSKKFDAPVYSEHYWLDTMLRVAAIFHNNKSVNSQPGGYLYSVNNAATSTRKTTHRRPQSKVPAAKIAIPATTMH